MLKIHLRTSIIYQRFLEQYTYENIMLLLDILPVEMHNMHTVAFYDDNTQLQFIRHNLLSNLIYVLDYTTIYCHTHFVLSILRLYTSSCKYVYEQALCEQIYVESGEC